jgi:hypothetical protein
MKTRVLLVLQCLELAFLATVVACFAAVCAKKREVAELGMLMSTLAAVVAGMVRSGRSFSAVVRWQRMVTLLMSPFAVLQLVLFLGWVSIGTPIAGWRQNAKFKELVREADRVEIHDMSRRLFDGASNGNDVCCVLTDKEEIAAFVELFGFAGKAEPCGCIGNPSIEWWKGDECIARLSVHHGDRFSITGCGDPVNRWLTCLSRLELKSWLESRCGIELK